MTRSRDVANIDTILTTKGDIYAASAAYTPTRLGVGNNGETLVADSSTSTGLRYNPQNALVNPLINGGMDIWQRGTSFTPAAGLTYTADRWQTYRGSTGFTVSRQTTSDTTNLPNIQYSLRLQRTSGNTSADSIYITQSIETANTIPYAGRTLTLSYYARAGANYSATSSQFSANVLSGTGTDQNVNNGYTGSTQPLGQTVTLTTTWQRFAHTLTLGATMTEFAAYFFWTPTGTAGADDWMEITGVQFDFGTYTASTAPAFRRSGGNIAGELAACLRYYELNYKTGDAPGTNVYSSVGAEIHGNGCAIVQVPVTGTAGSSRGRAVPVPYKVIKRATPTIRFWDLAGNLSRYTAADVNGSWISNNNSLDTFGGINTNSHMLAFQTAAASSAHIYCGIMWEASAEL